MTQPSLLMIRPQDAAHSFVDALAQVLGRPVNAIYSPVIHIEPVTAVIDLTGVTHLVFTSANAVKRYASLTADRDIPALCVGKTTQKAALETGLNATATGKTVADFLVWSKSKILPPEPVFLYLRGAQVSFDLLPELHRSGFQAREVVLYRQIQRSLSKNALNLMQTNAVVIPVFSANSACGLLKIDGLSGACNVHVVCISQTVAQKFAGFPIDRLTISRTPDRAGMIAALAELL